MRRLVFGWKGPAGELGLLLEGDQDLVDIAAGAAPGGREVGWEAEPGLDST